MASWGMLAARGQAASRRAQPAAHDALWRRLLLAIEHGDLAGTAAAASPGQRALPRSEISEFEPFFRAHERDIFTYLWRMTGDEQAAYDLTQETFLRAWRHFARVHDYERPGGWLFRVATHLALNHLRGRSTSLGSALSLDTPVANHIGVSSMSPDLSATIADADMVRRALMAIPSRHRAALVLREVYGLSCEEIATVLGVSAGAAKTLLWRARCDFRGSYQKEAR